HCSPKRSAMVFQGFSFFAMALVSIGVIAYRFYKNREANFYDAPHQNLYGFANELSYEVTNDEESSVRKRKMGKVETCSICMETVQSAAVSLPPEVATSAICLPCKHLFHTRFWVSWTLKHVTYLPSYISDTGSSPPESCIFGQMLNIVALLTSVLVYIKYRQLREILTRHDFSENLQKLNKFTLWTGYVAAFGMSVVGNFQEANMVGVHFTGAFFTFGSGALYQCLEVKTSLNGSQETDFLKYATGVQLQNGSA
ncbi:E3 ubiquitin-protein ligase RNF149-like, partial [Asbolus verrucosus]